MELQQFIEQTMKDITTGLHNSNKGMIDAGSGKGISDLNAMEVNFDIAVTVTNDKGNEVGGRITVLGIGLQLGGSQKQREATEHISRIKFTVPLRLKTLGEKFTVSVA